MKVLSRYISCLLFCLCLGLKAQLSGIVNVPGTYTSLSSAFSAINTAGISGALTVNIAAGYTETVINGGYTLSTSGTVANPITIRKNGTGARPIFYAYTGTKTPGSATQDGFLRLQGCDYVTIDGLAFIDLNSTNPATMEFGICFFRTNGIDGCQYNTISNCLISLSRFNNASGAGPAGDGSRGIEAVDATMSTHNAHLTIYSNDGTNSHNTISGNVITQCNIGVWLSGQASSTYSVCDQYNQIGGLGSANANTVVNFGGGGNASAAAGMGLFSQYDAVIAGNVITSNDGNGAAHPATLRGIQVGATPLANMTIIGNTVTVEGGGTSSQLTAIENSAGTGGISNTVTIANNLITNCRYPTSTSGGFYGIYNSGAPAYLQISGNRFLNNSTEAQSGSVYLVYNSGTPAMRCDINHNELTFRHTGLGGFTGTLYGIACNNSGTTSTVNITGNNCHHFFQRASITGVLEIISVGAQVTQMSLDSNRFHDLDLHTSGSVYMLHNSGSVTNLLTARANTITGVIRNAPSGSFYGYYHSGTVPATATHSIVGNLVSGISSLQQGGGSFYGIYDVAGNTSTYPRKHVAGNRVKDVSINGTGNFYGVGITDGGDAGTTFGSLVENNLVQNCVFSDQVYGLSVNSPVSLSIAVTVRSNTIMNVVTSGSASTAYGAYLGSNNAGMRFLRNVVANVVAQGANGTSHGIYCASGSTIDMVNNAVGQIQAPNASGANRCNGIYLSAATQANLIYNTVFLIAASSGTNFSTNALYASSGVGLLLLNNLLINKSAVINSGLAVAYRRSTSSLTNYLTTSGNNLFYAGVPSSSNVVFYNGSTYSTLSQFQTFVTPREATSLTQDIPFLSLDSRSPFYLHLQPAFAGLAESGAVNHIVTTQDIDGQTRQGNSGYSGSGSAPDIGCDEYERNTTPCSGAVAAVVSPINLQLCTGDSALVFASSVTPGTGLVHQWKVALNSSGPYSSTGFTNTEFYPPTTTSGNRYYVLETICPAASQTAISNQVTVAVQSSPAFTLPIQSTLVCGGNSFTLGAISGSFATYNWKGPDGFYSYESYPEVQGASFYNNGGYTLEVTYANGGCFAGTVVFSVTVSEVNFTVTPGSTLICSGSSVTLNATGSAVSYTWSNGMHTASVALQPTATTVYTLSGTNSLGCISSTAIPVNVITPTISAIDATVCGSAPNAVLGVNTYTPSLIQWFAFSSGGVPISTGPTYTLPASSGATVYARATGACTTPIIPVTLHLAPVPTVMAAASPSIVCPGMSSTLSVTGANSYSWSGIGTQSAVVVQPVAPTIYTVTGTALSSCSAIATISVGTFSSAVVSVSSSTALTCPAVPVSFTATGALSYVWSTGSIGPVLLVSPAASTNYSVYGYSADNCVAMATLAVQTKTIPVINITQSADTLCVGFELTLTAQGAISYTWLPTFVTGPSCTVYPQATSVFNVIGRSINTCTGIGYAYVFVDPCEGVGDQAVTLPIVAPNPSRGEFVLQFSTNRSRSVEVFDNTGRMVAKMEFSDQKIQLSMTESGPGLYVALVREAGNIYFLKLVIDPR